MSVKKVGDIEIFTSDESISHFTRKERQKRINELFRTEYCGKEISYLLNSNEIKALIDKVTRHNFQSRIHAGKPEPHSLFNKKQDIAFSGDYIPLISDANYKETKSELKAGQNKKHTVNTMWHTFTKNIIFDGELYEVVIFIREQNNKYYIHDTKLKEVSKPTINLVCAHPINDEHHITSFKNSITDEKIK